MGSVRPRLTLRARGDAPPDLVWERYADLDLWRTWSPQIERVQLARGEPEGARLRAGLEGVVHGPVGIAVRFRVTAVDEDALTWSWRVRPAPGGRIPLPVALDLDHAVLARDDGSETTLTISGRPPAAPLVVAYAPLARLALGRLVRP
jgi:uncharacterized protein YndB with AHSA1/START domain